MAKHKIVLVLQAFPKISETFIVRKFAGLVNKGWDVDIVCQHQENWDPFPELKKIPNVRHKIHQNWPHRPRWWAAGLISLALIRCLISAPAETIRYLRYGWPKWEWKTLRNLYLDAEIVCLKPDIVHFEFGPLAVSRTYLKYILNCSIVVSFRGYDLNFVGLEDPNYYQEIWKESTIVHFLGKDLRERALDRGCPVEKPYVLIPPAIQLEEFKPVQKDILQLGSAGRPLRILSVGRLHWKKGYEYALQAVQSVILGGIHCEYRIIGKGEHKEAILFARRQFGLENSVKLIGEIPHLRVIEELQWADIFVHAAVSEGYCNAVLEAQAMKLPVVCTDADGLSENISDNKTGFVVRTRDPNNMANKIAYLANSPETRCRMGEEGRKRVENCFQMDDQISAFGEVYKKILASQGEPS
jgi:colanic acid/amylovoran biosynthesis glycosyltransferase